MANAIYDRARQSFLEGGIAYLTHDINVQLVDTAQYTFSAAHQFLSDVPVGARVGTAQTLGGKTSTNGVADANDVTFTGLPNTSVEALIIYRHTGADGTANLIAYFDTITGLPFTTNGGSCNIEWNASGILRF